MTDYELEIERLRQEYCDADNVIKLCEECGELMQAVAKEYFLHSPENRQHVIEEMVDIQICLEIICRELDIDETELIDMLHHKMLRSLMRIEGDIDG